MQRAGHQEAPVGPARDLATQGTRGGRSRELRGSWAPSVATSPLPWSLPPPGCERRGGDGARREPRTDGRTARSAAPAWSETAVLRGGRGGQQRGPRQVREPLPGQKWEAGLRVCSQAGNHPRPPPTNPPREAGPAPGLREEAAGDSAISRGLRGSGSRAGYLSYGALGPGETEVAWTPG